MQAARFFLDAPLAPDTRVDLPSTIAHHATRVLRLRDGEPIVLFNGRGGEFGAQLSIDGKRAAADVTVFDPVERESALSITLVQSWIASDKLDWLIEKSVELGVHAIVLAPAIRSVVRLADDRLARRITRLREITIAACVQCGRNRIPQVEAATTFAGALKLAPDNCTIGLVLEPSATSEQAPLSRAQLTDQRIKLVVGPEGGFEKEEMLLAQHAGHRAYRLGPRVLRTETAGIAALATLQAIAGDFY